MSLWQHYDKVITRPDHKGAFVSEIDDIKLYKSLSADGRSCNGGHSKWSLPTLQPDGTYKPGRWMPRINPIVPCRRGYHVFERKDTFRWLNCTLYECEIRGETIDHGDKTVAESCRLLRPVPGCNERTLRLFACRVAEDTLPLYEARYPDDDRPRRTIDVARRYADGQATEAELAAARSAADAAAHSAADYAAHSAADAAACSAAYYAACSAADAAADAAADSAACSAAYYAARSAACSAAHSAADAAACSAAYSAADSAACSAADAAADAAACSAAYAKYTDWLWEMMEADAR